MGDLVVNKKGCCGRANDAVGGRESSVAAARGHPRNLGLGAACPSLSLGVMTWGNDEFPTFYKLLARWLVR